MNLPSLVKSRPPNGSLIKTSSKHYKSEWKKNAIKKYEKWWNLTKSITGESPVEIKFRI